MDNPFAKAPVRIGVIGLGYVGLPLAVAFGTRFETVGFDVRQSRVDELRGGVDRTLEVETSELLGATKLTYSSNEEDLKGCNVFVVAVPTPIDGHKRPDMSALVAASGTVGRVIQPGGVAIYESTVYPGATEEECTPVIEKISGLTLNKDFYAGYSPERANPGDREHRLATIMKVTAGSTPEVADFVDALYRSIVTAGTHKAPSIRVAEAAKVIENTQRDLNIALINEFSLIFNRLGIDTPEVLAAASTKWNFLNFRPGLVGGHCIGVDPYYLTFKAQDVGYHPEVILAGRRINDGMGAYVARLLVKELIRRSIQVKGARVLLMGLTFKEDCPDLRNTRVVDIVRELKDYEIDVDVHDPWVDPKEAEHEYGIRPLADPKPGHYDGVILAVGHQRFRDLGAKAIRGFGKASSVLVDVKAILPKEASDVRL